MRILAVLLIAALVAAPLAQAQAPGFGGRGILQRPQPDFGASARDASRRSAEDLRDAQQRRSDTLQRQIERQGDRTTDIARDRLGRRLSPLGR